MNAFIIVYCQQRLFLLLLHYLEEKSIFRRCDVNEVHVGLVC